MRYYLADKHGLQVQFFYDAVENRAASDKAGRPIYDKALFARCLAPNQSHGIVVHELERVMTDPESGKETTRHGAQYERFKELARQFKNDSTAPELNGTPVENLPGVDLRLSATLKALNVFTVEALAAAGDGVAQRFGVNFDLRKRARDFLDQAKGNAGFTRLEAENESLRNQLAALEQRVAALVEAGDDEAQEIESDDDDRIAPRRGRPPKVRA